ncbi:MAG: YlbF family regulator [Sporomusaceae bacterium]|nr:YlbF family regulator [Sporomusaceae bacterium]
MMNIHDQAHGLARALRQSEEYKAFLAVKEKIEADSQAKQMVKAFLVKKLEVEYAVMAGKPEDKEQMDALQRMFDVLNANANARDFLNAQMRFQQLMGDIYKIIGDSVAEGLDFLAKE